MFGYVTPCKLELKLKDYEKFKAYYCGLCKTIQNDFGNPPRLFLNYDMTFLAVLLDSLEETRCKFIHKRCVIHPLKKRVIITDNKALSYSAFFNLALVYYKMLDNVSDDKSKTSKLISLYLNKYIKNASEDLKVLLPSVEKILFELGSLEKNYNNKTLDELADPFAKLTGFILCSFSKSQKYDDNLYWLGYNLGKWIYIIDAFDDLENDMKNKKFNVINALLNSDNKPYIEFSKSIENRIDFILVSCAQQSLRYLNNLKLYKNYDLLQNILQYGLIEKMDKVFKRSEINNEKSL